MKLIDMDQLNAATSVQSRSEAEGKKLGEVMLELGFIDSPQLKKLEELQRSVLAKHRQKQAAALAARQGGGAAAATPQAAPAVSPTPAKPATPSNAATPRAARAASAPTATASETATATPAAQRPQAPPVAKPLPPGPASAAAAEPRPAAPPQPTAPAVQPPPTEDTTSDTSERITAPESVESLGLSALSPTSSDLERLKALLRGAIDAGASDIHIHSGAAARVRLNGVRTQTDAQLLSDEDTERMVMSVLSEDERLELLRYGELDACCDIPGLGRFRTNVYRQQRGFDAVLRSVSAEPPTLDQLGLPSWLAKYTSYHQGMVLITGPAGCGKSATMAAMVNLINEEREDHILTVEDPIEIVHPSKRCLVNQRHAGRHTGSFARALRAALREDPDVIVIGELRDLETISLAMTAAETGHFVLATLHTNNAVRTINRMIGAFPSNQQSQVRTMLSESLRAVISQRLVPRADETGRIPALELLVINKAIGNMIREEKTIQIRSSIQTGAAHGMMLLEQSLDALVRAGTITREAALELADDKKLITAE